VSPTVLSEVPERKGRAKRISNRQRAKDNSPEIKIIKDELT
jgi:hypothetical protein